MGAAQIQPAFTKRWDMGDAGSSNSGLSILEALVGLAILGLAAGISANAFRAGQVEIAKVTGQLESALLVQRVMDFISDPQLCKESNIAKDAIKFNNARWSTVVDLKEIRLGPTGSKSRGVPIIEKKDYGNFEVTSLLMTNLVPKFTASPTQNRAMVNLDVATRQKGYGSAVKRAMVFFVRLNANDEIVDCYVHFSEEQTCQDLGWQFDSTKNPRCFPPP